MCYMLCAISAALAIAPPAAFVACRRPALSRHRCARMAETADELLSPALWTVQGFSSVQGLVAVCQRLNQRRAEAEHLGISLLADGSIACRVVAAAGADPRSLRVGFEDFAAAQGVRARGGGEAPQLGESLLALLRKAAAQRRLLVDERLSAKHVLLALLEDARFARECGARVARARGPNPNPNSRSESEGAGRG